MIRRNIEMKKNLPIILGIVSVLLIISCAYAKCPPGGCGTGDNSWEKSAQAFISSDVPLAGVVQDRSAGTGSFKAGEPVGGIVNTTADRSPPQLGGDFVRPDSRTNTFSKGEILKPLEAISDSEVVLGVTNQFSKGDAHIRGTIYIPSKSFLQENGTLKPISEIAAILGSAGISREDQLIVYSDTFDSGEAAFVFWLLSYLGQEDVKALDGGLKDWTAASLSLETKVNHFTPANYTLNLKPNLLANYDLVASENAQLVDARAFLEYGKERMPNAFSISSDQVVANGKIKDAAKLNDTFAKLDRSKPIVVYSDDIFEASLVWFALQLMDFDSRIYSWQDWQNHADSKVYKIK
jgi:thiosulfate/3-mercaptopyruvate sulfurtransferase